MSDHGWRSSNAVVIEEVRRVEATDLRGDRWPRGTRRAMTPLPFTFSLRDPQARRTRAPHIGRSRMQQRPLE